MGIQDKSGAVNWVGAVLNVGSTYLYSGQSSHWALVWDAEKGEPKQVGTGWSDCGRYEVDSVKVDATDEVKGKYIAYKLREKEEARVKDRQNKARVLLANRAIYRDFAKSNKVNYGRVLKLARSYGAEMKLVLDLFKPRVRNNVKLSFRKQIVDWLNDPAPRYKSPLSPKQFGLLIQWSQPYHAWKRY